VASHNVAYVQQSNNITCWAACTAMLVNYRDGTHYTDLDIVREAGIDPTGGCDDSEWPTVIRKWGLSQIYGSCMTPEGWEQLLSAAPTMVGLTNHVVVAGGTNNDMDPERFEAYILDPWPSNGEGWWKFDRLEAAFELRANRELHMLQP